ncbi:hypothetical protein Sgou_45040 [Streptomyces gougerotii]|uniref:Glutamine--fructose-6-phosphate aminotransferase [isomerizing] n=1 Tax=Streptomyces gougerotii TaxID=53448 RepID=A0ABQ1DBE9_9ACTN|nr:hypothetical protein Sgou_45040 [Streptomyces gougerotii]
MVEVHPDRAVVTGFDGAPADARTYRVDWDASAAEKDGHDSFMLKEIAEQPKAVADTLLGRLDPALGTLTLGPELGLDPAVLRDAEKVVVIACGTAHHAGLVARLAVETLGQAPLRGRAGQRVPLPRPDRRPAHPGRRRLPVRGDRRHPDGGAARP